MNLRIPWTEQEKAAALSMAAEGKTDVAIGAALGRPARGVEKMRMRLGQTKDPGRPRLTNIKMFLSPWWTDANGTRTRALMGS